MLQFATCPAFLEQMLQATEKKLHETWVSRRLRRDTTLFYSCIQTLSDDRKCCDSDLSKRDLLCRHHLRLPREKCCSIRLHGGDSSRFWWRKISYSKCASYIMQICRIKLLRYWDLTVASLLLGPIASQSSYVDSRSSLPTILGRNSCRTKVWSRRNRHRPNNCSVRCVFAHTNMFFVLYLTSNDPGNSLGRFFRLYLRCLRQLDPDQPERVQMRWCGLCTCRRTIRFYHVWSLQSLLSQIVYCRIQLVRSSRSILPGESNESSLGRDIQHKRRTFLYHSDEFLDFPGTSRIRFPHVWLRWSWYSSPTVHSYVFWWTHQRLLFPTPLLLTVLNFSECQQGCQWVSNLDWSVRLTNGTRDRFEFVQNNLASLLSVHFCVLDRSARHICCHRKVAKDSWTFAHGWNEGFSLLDFVDGHANDHSMHIYSAIWRPVVRHRNSGPHQYASSLNFSSSHLVLTLYFVIWQILSWCLWFLPATHSPCLRWAWF